MLCGFGNMVNDDIKGKIEDFLVQIDGDFLL